MESVHRVVSVPLFGVMRLQLTQFQSAKGAEFCVCLKEAFENLKCAA